MLHVARDKLTVPLTRETQSCVFSPVTGQLQSWEQIPGTSTCQANRHVLCRAQDWNKAVQAAGPAGLLHSRLDAASAMLPLLCLARLFPPHFISVNIRLQKTHQASELSHLEDIFPLGR